MNNSARSIEKRNILARNAVQNVFQTAILDAADQTQTRLFIQPLYPIPDLGQEKVRNKLISRTLKGIARILDHIRMAQYVSQLDNGYNAVLYTMFLNIPVFLTFLFSGFRSKNVYFLAHFIQQIRQRRLYIWLFKFYIFLGYKFIVFEDLSLLASAGFTAKEMGAFSAIPHPVLDKNSPIPVKKPNQRKKVGLIGYHRSEKQMQQIMELLLRLQNKLNYDLILGTNDISDFNEIHFDNRTTFFNTTSRNDYFKALSVCDIIVNNYQEGHYYLRSSGVIADAIGTHTYCICPDFPIIRQQVVWPAPIGKVFKSIDSLPEVLNEVLNWEDAKMNPAFELHYQQRSSLTLANLFDEIMKTSQ